MFHDPIGVEVLGRLLAGETEPSTALTAAFSSVVRGYDHYGVALPGKDGRLLGQRVLSVFLQPPWAERA